MRLKFPIAKNNPLADRHLPSRPHQRFPCAGSSCRSNKTSITALQKFITRWISMPHRLRVHARAPAKEARRKHTRIVYDDEFIAAQQIWKFAKVSIFPRAARAIDEQHAGCVALRERTLGNRAGGQVVIEFARFIGGGIYRCSFATRSAIRLAITCRISSWIRPFDASISGPPGRYGWPARSVTVPPASRTSNIPAAVSHEFNPNSQKASKRPQATEQRSSAAEPSRRTPCERSVNSQ